MDNTIRPTLRAYPITLIFLCFATFMIYSRSNTEATLFGTLFLIMPLILLLFIQLRGTKYQIKNGVLKATRLMKPVQTLKLDQVQNVTIKPVFFGSGHLVLTAPGGTLTLKNIPGVSKLADQISGFS